MANAGVNAVVITLDVHTHDAIKRIFRRAFNVADLRYAGIIDQNVHAPRLCNVIEGCDYCRLIADIASVGGCRAAGIDYLISHGLGTLQMHVEDPNGTAICGELECDRAGIEVDDVRHPRRDKERWRPAVECHGPLARRTAGRHPSLLTATRRASTE